MRHVIIVAALLATAETLLHLIGAAAALDGKLYAFGGGGEGFQALKTVECYDPAKESWTPCAPMPTARSCSARG